MINKYLLFIRMIASRCWLAAFVLWMVCPSASLAETNSNKQLQLLADPSIALPLTRAARAYSREHQVSISLSFATSDEQLNALEQGGVADVFVSTRKDILQQMSNQGLIDIYSREALVKNRLCLATYHSNEFQVILIPKLPLADILERVDHDFTFAMPDPAASDFGVASMESLMNHELAASLEPYFRFYNSDSDLQDAIGHKGGYGVLPLTEAQLNPNIKILGTFPETAHQSLTYEAVVLAGDNMKLARKFLKYLATPEVISMFEGFGFQPVKAESSDNDHLARGSTSSESTSPL